MNVLGAKAFFYKCDLLNSEEIKIKFELAMEKFKKIDILINNAGIVAGKSIFDINLTEIKNVMSLEKFEKK